MIILVIYVAFEEGIEVNGATIMAIVDGMGVFKSLAKKFFEKAGLPEKIYAKDDIWYSQQKWLDAFKLIAQKVGPNTLFQIGTKIPENAIFPNEINNIEQALQSIDIAYHMNHRNSKKEILYDGTHMKEGIGNYSYKKILNEKKIIMTCRNPYPCDFDIGIISAMAKRFVPTTSIEHNDNKACRKDDSESCTYIVTW